MQFPVFAGFPMVLGKGGPYIFLRPGGGLISRSFRGLMDLPDPVRAEESIKLSRPLARKMPPIIAFDSATGPST